MTLFREVGGLPVWEPIPWEMTGPKADAQRNEFMARAAWEIIWTKAPFGNWPAEGVFGKPQKWFADHDANFYATLENEDMLLIQNIWHGFPDPPEWGLATRVEGHEDRRWSMWGHFSYLPMAWEVPGETDA